MVIAILLLSLSIFNIFIGNKVKEKKLANLLSGFDKEKDDVEYISCILGDTLKRIGNCGIILTAMYLVFMSKISVGVYLICYVSVIVLFIVNLTFKTDKHRRSRLKAEK
ncbi:hypothetical protein [Clostridium sp. LIBA-8841]|uniref:hypothetical protein n=1 Tax=Clostridium sp. LIBA-8841 TaxID=2987530 RepID=UPI002AC586C4|nr:hypothetical protein [Clostridium sp. LIBA-8841]MDZ5252276.1 hypothetical protein [Clostridium sp. LIBA-8841]